MSPNGSLPTLAQGVGWWSGNSTLGLDAFEPEDGWRTWSQNPIGWGRRLTTRFFSRKELQSVKEYFSENQSDRTATLWNRNSFNMMSLRQDHPFMGDGWHLHGPQLCCAIWGIGSVYNEQVSGFGEHHCWWAANWHVGTRVVLVLTSSGKEGWFWEGFRENAWHLFHEGARLGEADANSGEESSIWEDQFHVYWGFVGCMGTPCGSSTILSAGWNRVARFYYGRWVKRVLNLAHLPGVFSMDRFRQNHFFTWAETK